jgi:hypothetical protein
MINGRDALVWEMKEIIENLLSEQVLDAAIEVHRTLGKLTQICVTINTT